MNETPFTALPALDVPVRQKASSYPEPFFSRMKGRVKRQLGDHFGLQTFGINLTELAPGGESALMRRHTRQDEFIYILAGRPTLRTEAGEQQLAPGMCAGFPAGGISHHLVNRTDEPVLYLEIGDRTPGDEGYYPDDDLMATMVKGSWGFTHKDGTPYA